VRRYAARTIGQNAIASRAAVLRTLLADTDTAVAADAAFALGLLRDTASVTTLATAVTRSRTVADAAAWSLGELGSAALPVFERVLTSGQPATALASLLRASAKLRPVPAQLIEPYLTHVDPVVQRSAAYALTRARVPASTHALLALATRLEESPPEASAANNDSGGNTVLVDLRSYLARGLGKSVAGDSLAAGATLALQRLAADPHPHVRINAIRALATYGASARVVLLARLRDPDANARIAIAQSLGDALGSAPADWSAAWEADTSFAFRRALVASAVRLGVRLPALDAAAADAWQRRTDWRYRAAAAQASAAGSIADVDAIAAPLLRNPDARVRNAAYAAALSWSDSSASTGKPYARVALVQALADDDLFVRATILDALRARASVSDASVALRAWRAASRDPENDARVAALGLMAAAWTRDSMSFGSALRDSIAAVPPPADPVERSIGRASRLFAHWPSTAPLHGRRHGMSNRCARSSCPR